MAAATPVAATDVFRNARLVFSVMVVFSPNANARTETY